MHRNEGQCMKSTISSENVPSKYRTLKYVRVTSKKTHFCWEQFALNGEKSNNKTKVNFQFSYFDRKSNLGVAKFRSNVIFKSNHNTTPDFTFDSGRLGSFFLSPRVDVKTFVTHTPALATFRVARFCNFENTVRYFTSHQIGHVPFMFYSFTMSGDSSELESVTLRSPSKMS